MAATVLVRDLLNRVSVLLQDRVPQWTRWPEKELVDWLNDGQMAITKFLPAACSRIDAIKLKTGTRQSIEVINAADCKPGDGSTPAAPIYGTLFLEAFRNMGADGLVAGKVIRAIPREVMDSQSPDWHTVSGAIVRQFMFDPRFPRNFYVTPGVTGTVWVEIGYTAQPVKIPNTGTVGGELYGFEGSSTTVISIADEHVDDLVDYVVARAHMKEMTGADKNIASTFQAKFLGSLNAKVQVITGHNPNITWLPFAPEPLPAAK